MSVDGQSVVHKGPGTCTQPQEIGMVRGILFSRNSPNSLYVAQGHLNIAMVPFLTPTVHCDGELACYHLVESQWELTIRQLFFHHELCNWFFMGLW